MKSMLTKHGYYFDQAKGIWRRPEFDGIAYNDGDEVENRLFDIINNTKDVSVLSDELKPHCTDWPSLYHLSSSRANILRPFEEDMSGDILEIGAGCGAITRYLGECGANVLALEGTPRRAMIARSRTRDLKNVIVLNEKFESFKIDKQFDVITLIGVLEYANLFTSSDTPAITMLGMVKKLLKPDGKLIIAIENQLGLKYFAGAPEDHTGQAMYGIEGRYTTNQPQTYGREVLNDMLAETGFGVVEFLAPFPDYKLPVSIVTEAGFKDDDFDASAFAWQSVRRDPQLPQALSFLPELVWPSIFNNKLGLDLSNSFLIIASEAKKSLSNQKLGFHYSVGRVKQYCKQTIFERRDDGEIKAVCSPVNDGATFFESNIDSRGLIFKPEIESNYSSGIPLNWEFIQIISQNGWLFEDVIAFYKRYLEILSKLENHNGLLVDAFSKKHKGMLRGEFFDAIPQNIICLPNGKFKLIDTEWREAEDIPIGRMIFRIILLQLGSIPKNGRFNNSFYRVLTREQFVEKVFIGLGLINEVENFYHYSILEARTQEVITGKSFENFINWSPKEKLYDDRLNSKDEQIEQLNQELNSKDGQIEQLNQELNSKDGQILQLTISNNSILSSRSWRYTAALRRITTRMRPSLRALKLLMLIVRQNGGIWNLLTKTVVIYRKEGAKGVFYRTLRLSSRFGLSTISFNSEIGKSVDRNDYQSWIKLYDNINSEVTQKIHEEINLFECRPTISVIMPVYNPPIKYLEEAIKSVQNQIYVDWELCIADDASTDKAIRPFLESLAKKDSRIKIAYREKNGHISAASNSALELATGEYVALLDNDDLLPIHAFFHVAKAILANPDVVLIYSDEDKINANGFRYDPYFKCELNYELLLAQNMICHLAVYKRDLLMEVKGFRVGLEGAQDYDLALRVFEKVGAQKILHIPKVLYHWRAISGSTALNIDQKNYATDAARRAVAEHLVRSGRGGLISEAPKAPFMNRVRYPLPEHLPLVSIIIPTRDKADLLNNCLNSIFSNTTYENYELIVVDNGSIEVATKELFDRQPKDKVCIVRDDLPFNYSRLNNLAVKHAKGDVVCLMNNDIEILTSDWLEEMVSFALQEDIGCVGAKLLYPDGRLQHGGVILGLGGVAGHSHKYLSKYLPGYFHRAMLHQSFSAVTAACLVVNREVWNQVGGLDEDFAVAFNDVDFCLRVREAGYRNVWTPYAEMIHHESLSRGPEDNPKKVARFNRETSKMKERWSDKLFKDPAYSPNLTLDFEDFSYSWPPRTQPLL
jgi:glycosyltransferase involved in cell wall biosynthesis/2-polyprenyl-3-methyl-5-hydroxy-6-metoxy-1,4-benzoquinol methylase